MKSDRLKALLLLGPTSSGKTPLGDLLEQQGLGNRRCVHFDFGANLRGVGATGQLPSTGRTPTGLDDAAIEVIHRSLHTGTLLENEHFPIARKLLVAFSSQRGMAPGDLLILNGLPRHVGQADDVDAFVSIERIVVLNCSANSIQRRISGDPGGDRAERRDDDPALVARKLTTYQSRTMPLVQHYQKLGIEIQTLEVGPETKALDLAAQL